MPSDRERTESEEALDERDEAEAEAEARSSAAALDEGEGEAPSDAPRNRAERRAAMRRARRGLPAEGTPAEASGDARPRLPPKTMKGKSSADEVAPWARGLVDWLARHRRTLIAGAAAVVLVSGSAVTWTMVREKRHAEAASLYHEAVRIHFAEIRSADAPPDRPDQPPRRGPTFPNPEARSNAALGAFRRVTQRFPNAPIAPLARLGEATALYELGRWSDARRVYESLLGQNVAGQEGQVIRGLAFSLEASGQLDAALRRFEELARVSEGAYRDEAVFHQARVLHRLNRDSRARDLLHGLVERLNRARPDEAIVMASSSLYEEARSLLHEIDPSDALGRRSSMPGPGSIDPEMLRRIFESQRGGAGIPGGGH